MLLWRLSSPSLASFTGSSFGLFSLVLGSFWTPKSFWILFLNFSTIVPSLLWILGKAPSSRLSLSWISTEVLSQIILWVLFSMELMLMWLIISPFHAQFTSNCFNLRSSIGRFFILSSQIFLTRFWCLWCSFNYNSSLHWFWDFREFKGNCICSTLRLSNPILYFDLE